MVVLRIRCRGENRGPALTTRLVRKGLCKGHANCQLRRIVLPAAARQLLLPPLFPRLNDPLLPSHVARPHLALGRRGDLHIESTVSMGKVRSAVSPCAWAAQGTRAGARANRAALHRGRARGGARVRVQAGRALRGWVGWVGWGWGGHRQHVARLQLVRHHDRDHLACHTHTRTHAHIMFMACACEAPDGPLRATRCSAPTRCSATRCNAARAHRTPFSRRSCRPACSARAR